MKFGTPLSQLVQPFTYGQYDVIFNNLNTALNSGSNVTSILNNLTLNSYSAILIETNGITAGGAILEAVTASIGFPLWGTGPGFSGAMGDKGYVILPIANKIGDNLNVGLIFNTTPTGGSTLGVRIFGLTNTQPPKTRGDCRLYPIGRHAAFGVTGAGAGATVIANPGATLRILVSSISVSASGGNVQLQGTIGGVAASTIAFTFGIAGNFADPPFKVPEEGILLDANSALTLNAQAGSTQACAVLYDIVPL
jgi:hypothetical protein